ncbi:hypothetical protein D3C84_295530 [compost metagenome]
MVEGGHGKIDHQPRALLGELTHPAIERGRQTAGILLQGEHRIGVLVGHAQLHRFQGGLTRLCGVDDELQVVLQLHQLLVDLLNERSLLTTASQYSISGHKGTTDAGTDGLGRVPFHVGDLANAGVVIQRGQYPLERLIIASNGGEHVQRLLRALQGLHVQIGQQFLPLVDVIGDIAVVDLTGDLLAIRLAQLAQLALAQHPGIHSCEIDERLVLLEEEVVETGPGEQPRHLAGVVAAQGKHGIEGGAHLVTHVEIRRQHITRLHHQILVDPLIHGQLAELALGTVDRLLERHKGGDGGLIPLGSGAIPVGVVEGIAQVPHQLLLHRPLPREGLLPAARHVLRHQLLVATGRIVQHPHHPQDGELLFAPRRCLVEIRQQSLHLGRQEAQAQQLQVGALHIRTNLVPLVETEIRHQRHPLTVVAKGEGRLANEVQPRQLAHPEGVGIGHLVGLHEGLGLGQYVAARLLVDPVEVVPTTDEGGREE